MSKSQLIKGSSGERAVVNKLKAAGFCDASRNLEDRVDRRGVDVTAANLLIQVKTYKKYAPLSKFDEIKDHDGLRALVTKGNHKPWMICMQFDDFLAIAQDIGLLYD